MAENWDENIKAPIVIDIVSQQYLNKQRKLMFYFIGIW